jgi:hypothetical protein
MSLSFQRNLVFKQVACPILFYLASLSPLQANGSMLEQGQYPSVAHGHSLTIKTDGGVINQSSTIPAQELHQ